jgi:DNA-binding transcriptional LysR family regulator
MRYTLRQLEVFLAVARDESVSRAAEALFMSQSAVSGSLAELERQFDVKLFDRVGKRLQLSERGRALVAPTQAVLDQARDLERSLEHPGQLGRLRIGATLTIGDHLAVPLIVRFTREQRGAQVTLEIGNTEEIVRRVANFELDVGLVEGELHDADLDVTPWRDDELVVFCAPDHPFAHKRALHDDDLRAAHWIVREPGSGTRQTFDRAMYGLVPELRIVLALQHTEAIKAAVMEGLGVGCISRIALRDELERGVLKACKVPERDFRRRFFFVLHKQKYRSAAIERWIELCRTADIA